MHRQAVQCTLLLQYAAGDETAACLESITEIESGYFREYHFPSQMLGQRGTLPNPIPSLLISGW